MPVGHVPPRQHLLSQPLCQCNGLAPFALDHELRNTLLEGLDLIAAA
jgi:hypothetical protein